MIRYPIKYKSVNKDHNPKKCRLIITDSGESQSSSPNFQTHHEALTPYYGSWSVSYRSYSTNNEEKRLSLRCP